MSTETQPIVQTPNIVDAPLQMKEVAEMLVRHYGLHEGKYDLMIEYQIGTGAVGPQPEMQVPGLLFGVAKLGLSKVDRIGPLTIDAAVTNPVKRPRAK